MVYMIREKDRQTKKHGNQMENESRKPRWVHADMCSSSIALYYNVFKAVSKTNATMQQHTA